MAENTAIEWTEATWNPWHGCHKVSAGCKNCYMFREKKQYGQDPNVVVRSKTKFYDPLKWTEPRKIFTCSWSDFFIEEADPWRDEAFAIMALTPQHTYQVLTKRPDRMLEYFSRDHEEIIRGWHNAYPKGGLVETLWTLPLPNVWLGVSVEDQKTADERIPLLLKTPAAVRWLSIEPLLGPVDLSNLTYQIGPNSFIGNLDAFHKVDSLNKGYAWPGIDWVVVGGESGHEARPMHPDWARSIRDQCQAANVPFFFKQWGEWLPCSQATNRQQSIIIGAAMARPQTDKWHTFDGLTHEIKIGKTKAGRLLDGREYNEMPEVTHANG